MMAALLRKVVRYVRDPRGGIGASIRLIGIQGVLLGAPIAQHLEGVPAAVGCLSDVKFA